MSKPPIVYDILRLFLAAGRPSPRGIDRVDFAYAHHLFHTWAGDCFGILPTPWGIRLYDRRQVVAGLTRVSELWREGTHTESDARFGDVLAFLRGAEPTKTPRRSAERRAWLRHLTGPASVLLRTGITLGAAVAAAPRGALYLNVGQLGWAAGTMTGWLAQRPDIHGVFLLHDVIPLDHPELVSRAGRWSHSAMLRAVDRHARGVICTTEAATRRVVATLDTGGSRGRIIRALQLPIAPTFLEPLCLRAYPVSRPYFVMCGAIEPRKNHALLIAAWTQMVRANGAAAPRLVVVGSPGAGGGAVLQELLRPAVLRDHVMVITGLRTPALRQLVAGARASLMPSWAEGFGLPVIEALTLGTPVIASDLPAHREVGGACATYLPPDDPAAWAAEISRRTIETVANPAEIAALEAFHPITEAAYFATVRAFLQEVVGAEGV